MRLDTLLFNEKINTFEQHFTYVESKKLRYNKEESSSVVENEHMLGKPYVFPIVKGTWRRY